MTKKPLVFVHGYLGGSVLWSDQISYFSNDYKVITPDLPGFGNNTTNKAPTRIEDFANYVLDVVSSKGIDKFDLVGHSMGGMIVQEMVAQAPQRVNHLILYGTGPVGLMPNRFETVEQSRQRAMQDGPCVTAKRIAATWFTKHEQATHYGICAELAENFSIQAVLAGLEAMEQWDGRDALPMITTPTLVLWGDQDASYRWDQPYMLWQKIPRAQLAVVPDCGHMLHLEKPYIFNKLISDFLD